MLGIIAGERHAVKNLIADHIDLSGCLLPCQLTFSNALITSRQKAGRSFGSLDVMRLPSTSPSVVGRRAR